MPYLSTGCRGFMLKTGEILMKFAKLALIATTLAATPMMAHAQDVGTTIFGNDDAPIGTVVSNADGIVTIDTGTHQAPLPAELIGQREIGFSVNATKAQIDDMMAAQVAAQEQAMAEAKAAAEAEAAARLEAALVVGAEVITADSKPLGLVDEITDANVIVITPDEQLVTLPQEFFAADAEGTLFALGNHADIMAALEQVGG